MDGLARIPERRAGPGAAIRRLLTALAEERRAATRLLTAGALLALAAHGAAALLDPGGRAATLIFYVVASLAVAACIARAGARGDEDGIWIPAAIAGGAWFVGSAYYGAPGPALERLSSFSFADLALVLFFAPAALALGRLVPRQIEPFQPTILLDGVIISLGAATVAATAFGLGLGSITLGTEPTPFTLLYPLAALLLFSFSVWVVALTGWRFDRLSACLLAGLGVSAVTSTAFVFTVARGTYVPGGALETLWLGGVVAIAVGAWQPRGKPVQVQLEVSHRIFATSAAALSALALLIVAHFASLSALPVGFAAATLLAMVIRAGVSFKESVQMFAEARMEAQTDSLTGLGNRRKLMTDLRRELEAGSVESPRVLVMFDLDGFKRYNDTYGHPAGDALLARLGINLGRSIRPYGGAYRIGGDEFCVLVTTGASSAKTIIALAAAALSERGEGFSVQSSYGVVILPH
jgi:two-component system, cell cycle response regulator